MASSTRYPNGLGTLSYQMARARPRPKHYANGLGTLSYQMQRGPLSTAPHQTHAVPAAIPAPAPAAQAPPASPNGDVSTPADIRDSTYGAGLAGLLGQIQAQRQAVQAAGQTDQQNYNENMASLAQQRGKTLDATKQTANHEGLLYSGILGARQGDVNASYDQQQNGQREALGQRAAARQAQLQQIGDLTADPNSPYGYAATGGAGIDFYNLLRDAADRRVGQEATDPVSMAPENPTTAALPSGSGRPTAHLSYRQMSTRNPAMKARVKARVLAGRK